MNIKKSAILAVSLLTALSLSFPALAQTTPTKGTVSGKHGTMLKKVGKGKKVIKKKTVKGKVKGSF